MKTKWNLVEQSFGNSEYAVAGVESKNCYWNKTSLDDRCPTFYANGSIYDIRKKMTPKRKSIGFLLESKAIIPEVYEHAHRVINKFNLFFTHDSELLKYSNAKWIPGGGVWIGGEYGRGEIKIYHKKKLISMVSSNKRMCPLHEFRIEVINKVRNKPGIEIFAPEITGWTPIIKTLEDYMFSVVIENYVDDLYFTEKINNCFATGTIPIYYGAKHIGKIYNSKGIITFSTLDELLSILNDLDEDEYYKRIDAVNENFEKCKQFISIEDYIYDNYFMANSGDIPKENNISLGALRDFVRRNKTLARHRFKSNLKSVFRN